MALKELNILLTLLMGITGMVFSAGLEPFNVDRSKISVSGISSGGAMAVQFHVAYSSEIMGVGAIAGVPFLCTPAATCMTLPSLVSVVSLWTLTASARLYLNIDSTSNMATDRIWIFAGAKDSVVHPGIGAKIEQYYSHYVNSDSQIKFVNDMDAEHGQITQNYGSACSTLNTATYMNNCNYDSSYDLLNHIYGNLIKPDANYQAQGELRLFDQTIYTTSSAQMETLGYVYIPTGCKSKTTKCKLHIAFHGCLMGRSIIGDTYARHAGYNEVGELNNIIILYPQVGKSSLNIGGCWDWFGYTSLLYYPFRSGPQMAAVHRMMKALIL